jgi:cytochrome c553
MSGDAGWAQESAFSRRGRRGACYRLGTALCLLALSVVPPARAQSDGGWSPSSGDTARALRYRGDPEAGAVAYAGCAVCHGADGAGRVDGTFPRIAGQHGTVVVKQVNDIRSGRRGNPVMASHVAAVTDPAEIADVAAYIELLSPRSSNGRGDGEDVQPGIALYQRDCKGCHGPAGQGSAEGFVPVIAGQHYAYLLRKLRAIASSRRRNAHPSMVEAIFDYADEELQAVARYLAQLPWPRSTMER